MFRSIFILTILLLSCSKNDDIVFDKVVYENDFDSNNSKNLSNYHISNYNNTNVLGDYNNSGFSLHLNELDKHNKIVISFDLYIHGSWDGNYNGFENEDRPDLWKMELGVPSSYYNNYIFETTFSNSPCTSSYCLKQSFPNRYPHLNNPSTDAHKTGLERMCNDKFGGPTTLYKFEKTLSHSDSSAIFTFYDKLYQPNANKNGINYAKCDESWSIDNLIVRIINVK